MRVKEDIMGYIPLDFCKRMSNAKENANGALRKVMDEVTENPQECMKFIYYDTDFLTDSYRGPFSEMNQWLIKNQDFIIKIMFGISSNLPEKERKKALLVDFIACFLFVELWKRDKEVYAFDPELEFSLSDIDEIEIPVRILERLPYHTFYLEFAEDGIYSSHFHGAFIHIQKYQDTKCYGYLINVMRLCEDGKTMLGKGKFLVDANEPDGKLILTKNQDTPCSDSECDRDWPEFVMFMLNALLYLCSENAEIRENAVTKNTYRPSNRVRNRFSEIRKMDCGFVYGSEVRKHRKAHVEQQKECKSRETTSIRHAMRPHTRKAHWHHYWVGKGRKELVLRWIAPTVVGTGERVATIHRVRHGQEDDG